MDPNFTDSKITLSPPDLMAILTMHEALLELQATPRMQRFFQEQAHMLANMDSLNAQDEHTARVRALTTQHRYRKHGLKLVVNR